MRLIAAGCSMTYGHGLIDCFVPPHNPGEHPSKYAWPQITANKLGLECINLSRPGGGNDNIIRNTLSIELQSTDTVVILWSFITRSMIYTTDSTEHHGEWDEDYMRNLFEYSNAYDLELKTLIKVHNFTKYLESRDVNIKYMFIDRLDSTLNSETHYDLASKLWNDIKHYDITHTTFNYIQNDFNEGKAGSFALDGNHPGEEWHRGMSRYLLKHFK